MQEEFWREPFNLGTFRIIPELFRVEKDGRTFQLEPKAMGVLLCLCQAKGSVVQRQMLLDQVWEGQHVTDYVLSRCISSLRKVLGDEARNPTFIETVRKGGYRLLILPELLEDQPENHPTVENSRFPSGKNRNRLMLIAISLFLGFGGLVWFWFFSNKQPLATIANTSQRPLTTLLGSELDPSISPDGKRLVFAWDGSERRNFNLYQKWMGQDEVTQLTEMEGEEKNPVWSPDGGWVAFVYAGEKKRGIYKLSSLGGEPVLVTETVSGDIPDLAWSADGQHLYFPDRPTDSEPFSIFQVNLQTKEKLRITHPPQQCYGDRDFALSPDGRYLALARALVTGVEQLWLFDLKSQTIRLLNKKQLGVVGISFLPNLTHLVLGVIDPYGSQLYTCELNSGELKKMPAWGRNGNDPAVSAANTALVFEKKQYSVNSWYLEKQKGEWQAPKHFASSTMWDSFSALSGDGQTAAFISNRNGTDGLWVTETAGKGTPRFLVEFRSFVAGNPVFSAENDALIYSDLDNESVNLWRVDLGGGAARVYLALEGNQIASSWSGSGRYLYYGSDTTGTWQVWRFDTLNNNHEQITRNGGLHAMEGKNHQWLYISKHDEPGLWRLHMASGTWEKVSDEVASGFHRSWDLLEDGVIFQNETAFANQTSPFYFLRFKSGETYHVGEPMVKLGPKPQGLRASPDGNRIYFSKFDRIESDIWLVENSGLTPATQGNQ